MPLAIDYLGDCNIQFRRSSSASMSGLLRKS